jgi:hypothetical protein
MQARAEAALGVRRRLGEVRLRVEAREINVTNGVLGIRD